MTGIRRTAAAAVCAVLLLGTAIGAWAGELTPSKPSQVVVGTIIDTSSPPCPNGIPSTFQLTLRLNADGTQSAFAIPPKSVLVVNRFSYSLSTTSINLFVEARLIVVDPANLPEIGFPSARDGAITDAQGRAVGSSEIPGGFVVKPPAVLCAQVPSGPGEHAAITVHGFFARDK